MTSVSEEDFTVREDVPPAPDWWNMAAQRFHGKPAGWMWHTVNSHDEEVPPGHVKVIGAVPIGAYRSGKRKGRPKWPKECETIWIKLSDIAAVKTAWEAETGRCATCHGKGGRVKCASAACVTYRKCRKCNGTGNSQ